MSVNRDCIKLILFDAADNELGRKVVEVGRLERQPVVDFIVTTINDRYR